MERQQLDGRGYRLLIEKALEDRGIKRIQFSFFGNEHVFVDLFSDEETASIRVWNRADMRYKHFETWNDTREKGAVLAWLQNYDGGPVFRTPEHRSLNPRQDEIIDIMKRESISRYYTINRRPV